VIEDLRQPRAHATLGAAQQPLDWSGGGFTPTASALAKRLRARETKAAAILALLRHGGARRSEVMKVGGDRFSARIGELRAGGHYIVGPEKAPRWGINERTEPYPDGEDMYVLVEPPPEGWRPGGGR
jgi:hypothetical protein